MNLPLRHCVSVSWFGLRKKNFCSRTSFCTNFILEVDFLSLLNVWKIASEKLFGMIETLFQKSHCKFWKDLNRFLSELWAVKENPNGLCKQCYVASSFLAPLYSYLILGAICILHHFLQVSLMIFHILINI